MQANAIPLLAIFEKKMRLEVPMFQRQYVWGKERHWTPLWEDISRKFSEYVDGNTDRPAHFLGAMVLDQKQTPTTHIERRQIIDGQQRLTTFQIVLAAIRDFCASENLVALADECDSFILNKGIMPDPAKDKFKVWPTQRDRDQFIAVVETRSYAGLLKRYPLTKRKYARRPEPRPAMIEAYLFFYESFRDFVLGTPDEPVPDGHASAGSRVEQCFQALRNSLLVVAIDLESGDDAQVIFETLNSRGEPLLPADLLRNYIFLRVARENGPQDELYERYWRDFDDPFWREIARQGRLSRPKSDLFMQHFLASRRSTEIPVNHLYVEYKYWIEKFAPFSSTRAELEQIAKSRDLFRKILEPKATDSTKRISRFTEVFDVKTVYPVILRVLEEDTSVQDQLEVFEIIESYLLRRSICGLTSKNYNRVFLTLARLVRSDGPSAQTITDYLASLTGPSTGWPSDASFWAAWSQIPAYSVLNQQKIIFILELLNSSYASAKNEQLSLGANLSVEHLMPQSWVASWPLPDGETGLARDELYGASFEDDPRVTASKARNAALQTLGNLTILSNSLNSSVSNSSWSIKKKEIARYSLLPINLPLQAADRWDEEAIAERSREMFARAVQIWKRPSNGST